MEIGSLFILAVGVGLFMSFIDILLSRFHPKNVIATFLLTVIATLLFVICIILYESSPFESRVNTAIENSPQIIDRVRDIAK